MKKILLHWIIILSVGAISSCSYIADYIEGELTDRSSFSISAQYINGVGVIILWHTDIDIHSFAGYEIYMTEQPYNEFSSLCAVGAGFDIINTPFFIKQDDLLNPATNIFIHDQAHLPVSPGIYFYRVAIIAWETHDYDGNGEKDSRPTVPDEILYKTFTYINKISSSAMVLIE